MGNDHDVFHYTFIHNVFGCFIENTLEYFADYLYPRFQHKGVATYDKAVEYLRNKEDLGREGDKPNLPAIFLNPTGDFNLDDANSLARNMWRFPHLAPGQSQGLFDPIYLDKNVEITVAFTRIKGEIELLSLLPSFYEWFDLKMYFIQMFGGEGRYIEPMYFNDFIILPPELVNYQYENDITGESYKLDWSSNSYNFLVETTNQNELVVPGKVKPRFVMRGMSDGSTRYGGADAMAEWRLSTMIEYEIEIPSYIILKTNGVVENVDFKIDYGSVYSTYDEYNIPEVSDTVEVYVESGLQDNFNTVVNPVMVENPDIQEDMENNENTNTVTEPVPDPENPGEFIDPVIITEPIFDLQKEPPELVPAPDPPPVFNLPPQDSPSEQLPEPEENPAFKTTPSSGICSVGDKIIRQLVMKTRYFHKVTEEQADSTEDVIIVLPERIYDTTLLKVNSKYGPLEYGIHFVIENAGKDMRLIIEKIELNKNDMIELFVYDVPFNASNPIFIVGGSSYISTTGEGVNYRPSLTVEWALRGSSNSETNIDGEI